MLNPEFIHTVVFSLISPHWMTRKLVCDLLVFLCYCQHRQGHEHVLRGLELLQHTRHDFGLFDSWLKDFERTIDGRGKMGSMVGATDDFKRMGMFNTADNHLMEYAVRKLYTIMKDIS